MDRYHATTALPYVHLHRATAELQGKLRRRLVDGGVAFPDWTTLRVIGPFEVFDERGGVCFQYHASVRCRAVPEHAAAVV